MYIYIRRYVHSSKKQSATSPLKYLLRIMEIFIGLLMLLNQLFFSCRRAKLYRSTPKEARTWSGKQFPASEALQNPPQPTWQVSAGLHPSSLPRCSGYCCGFRWLLEWSEASVWVFSATFNSPAGYRTLGTPEVVS